MFKATYLPKLAAVIIVLTAAFVFSQVATYNFINVSQAQENTASCELLDENMCFDNVYCLWDSINELCINNATGSNTPNTTSEADEPAVEDPAAEEPVAYEEPDEVPQDEPGDLPAPVPTLYEESATSTLPDHESAGQDNSPEPTLISNDEMLVSQAPAEPVLLTGIIENRPGDDIGEVDGSILFINSATGNVENTLPADDFSLELMPGTYEIILKLDPTSRWLPGKPAILTVAAGDAAKRIHLKVNNKNTTITGTIVDQDSKPITNLPIRIVAINDDGGFHEAEVNPLDGVYNFNVSPGIWFLKAILLNQDGFYLPLDNKKRIEVAAGDAAKQDFTFMRPNAVITGQVLRTDGKPAIDKWVSINSLSAASSEPAGLASQNINTGMLTNNEGRFNFFVPAGIYYIKAHAQTNNDFNNPSEQKISVMADEQKEVNLQFRASNALIAGWVTIQDQPVQAHVSAWSDAGGFIEARSDAEGHYELKVPNAEAWYVSAKAIYEDNAYKSTIHKIEFSDQSSYRQPIALERIKKLPETKQSTITSDTFNVIRVNDGAQITAPASSILKSGKATITIKPDPEISDTSNNRVIGLAYDITATDEQVQPVTQLEDSLTVTLPYNPDEINDLNVSISNLNMAYWDEMAQTWRHLDNSVVDEEANAVSATVDHLTRFAIVAAADITPPAAPSNLAAQTTEVGVSLTWTNPDQDFSHVKVYRSTLSGELGELLATDISLASFSDAHVTEGTTYYYTVRSVDPAGNESTNTSQVSATGTSVVASQLAEQLAGRILLQVEQNGEAWYVNPDSKQRYYLGRPDDAFAIMRSQGLGITNKEVNRIGVSLTELTAVDTDNDGLSDIFEDAIGSDKNSTDTDGDSFNDYMEIKDNFNPLGEGKLNIDSSLGTSLQGKILLQVEQNGEAWYVYPENQNRYFLGRPHDAFNVMRVLGLGISDQDLAQIPVAPDSSPVL